MIKRSGQTSQICKESYEKKVKKKHKVCCWQKTNSTKTSGLVIAARNELVRKIQFELTVLESLVRFLNR